MWFDLVCVANLKMVVHCYLLKLKYIVHTYEYTESHAMLTSGQHGHDSRNASTL